MLEKIVELDKILDKQGVILNYSDLLFFLSLLIIFCIFLVVEFIIKKEQ